MELPEQEVASTAAFAGFSILPTEIRLKIWQVAAIDHRARVLEVRLPEMYMYTKNYETKDANDRTSRTRDGAAKTSIPSALRVNREARNETLRFYMPARIGRMHVRCDDPFPLFRPSRDIIFVAEAAPSKMRRIRPLDVASFPLECLAETVETVEKIEYVAMVVLTQDLLVTNVIRMAKLLQSFKNLKELILVVPTFQRMYTAEELRTWGFEVPKGERVLVDPWEKCPDRLDSLEVNTARIKEFEKRLGALGTETWRPPTIRFRHAVKGA